MGDQSGIRDADGSMPSILAALGLMDLRSGFSMLIARPPARVEGGGGGGADGDARNCSKAARGVVWASGRTEASLGLGLDV